MEYVIPSPERAPVPSEAMEGIGDALRITGLLWLSQTIP